MSIKENEVIEEAMDELHPALDEDEQMEKDKEQEEVERISHEDGWKYSNKE